MGDRQDAARVAWAAIKLSQVGQCPVSLDQLATQVGIEVAKIARLLAPNDVSTAGGDRG